MCALVHVPAWTQSSLAQMAPEPASLRPDRLATRAADWLAANHSPNDPSSPLFAVAIAARHSVTPPVRIDDENVAEILRADPDLGPFIVLAGQRLAEGSASTVTDSPWARAMLAALACTRTAAPDTIPPDLFSQDPWIVTHTATALQWMFEQGCVQPADWRTLQTAIEASLQRIATDLDVTTTLGTEILAVVLYTRTPLEGLSDYVEALRRDVGRDGSFYAPDNDTWHRTMLAWWALLEWQNRAITNLPALTQLVPRPVLAEPATASFQGVDMTGATAQPVPQPTPIALGGSNADPQAEASGASATPEPKTEGSGGTTAALQGEPFGQVAQVADGSSDLPSTPELPPSTQESTTAPAQSEPIEPAVSQNSTQRAPVGCMGG